MQLVQPLGITAMTRREPVSMQVSMGRISHSIGATALEDVRRPSLLNSAIFISLIGFVLHFQMRRKKETPRKTKTVGQETGGVLTLGCDKQILKSNLKTMKTYTKNAFNKN